jgi:hypothetical protein
MDGERNSIGEIMLAKESAVSPGIACEIGAEKAKWLQGDDSDRDPGRGVRMATEGGNSFPQPHWPADIPEAGR